NNYEQTGLLTTLHYFAANKQLFLRNFYTKSKRSILKARTEGPAAYVLPGDRSEEHTSELQSRVDLVCRLLLEKKKQNNPRNVRLTCRGANEGKEGGRNPSEKIWIKLVSDYREEPGRC